MLLKNYLLFCVFLLSTTITFAQIYNRTDTLFIPDALVLPVIDGLANDEAWELTEWNNIDQIWMPYNNDPANLGQEAGLKLWEGPDDFTGRFKVLWSSETNLLYFLAEIIDDVYVDGYEHPGSGYHNWDVLELFIDENRSGGEHIFDTNTSKAANAFAYHLLADALDDGEKQTEFLALDMAGTSWNNVITRNYIEHFNEFAMRREGTKFIWEFSLIVHNDSYMHNNQAASVVELYPGKVMGLSVAYCDNDDIDENPKQRDHFFGSVPVPLAQHNSHWQNADWFGVAKLTGEDKTNISDIVARKGFRATNTVSNGTLYSNVISETDGKVEIRLLSMSGAEIVRESFLKDTYEFRGNLQIPNLSRSMYIVEIKHAGNVHAERVIVF